MTEFMSKNPIVRTYYDIFGSQQLPLRQLQYSLHKESTQIVFYMIVDQRLDFELLKSAVNQEIARNDCLRIRFKKHEGKLKQYFIPEYKLENIPFLDFSDKTKEEQDSILSQDAHTPLKTKKDEMYRFIFYRTYDGRTGIYLNISHIIADLCGVLVIFSDLLDVIIAAVNGTPMPKPLALFEDCLKKDLQIFNNKEEIEKHKQFYKEYYSKYGPSFYAGPDGMRSLNKLRLKKKDPNLRYMTMNTFFFDKSDNYGIHLPAERAAPILSFCEKNNIPLQTMIYVGMRTYLSRINEGTDDVTFMIAVNRRITLADKRSGGCRVNALPLRTVISKDKTFMQAIEQTQEIQFQILRHADFLFVFHQEEIKAMEHMSLLSWTQSMLFTCVPLSLSLPEGWRCEFGNYSNGRFTMPLYTVVVPNINEGGLDFHFEYMVRILQPYELETLLEQSVRIMEAGVTNPDITIGELIRGAADTGIEKDAAAVR